MRIAQIKYVKRRLARRKLIVQGREHSVCDFIHESVVASHGAVSEYRNRFAGFHESRKLPNRQIRALARAVHRKEPQANRRYPVQMGVGMTKKFSCEFGGRVGRD